MAIRAEVLRAMKEAGATVEVMIAAVEAEQAAERAEIEAAAIIRREKAAEKKRRQRAKEVEMSPVVPGDTRGQQGTHGDIGGHWGTAPNDPAPLPPHTPPITPTPNTHTSDPDGSAAVAASIAETNPRKELFGRGKQTLSDLTGRGRDGCGSLIGKWLKIADDSAVIVLAAIDEAAAKELAYPIPYIEQIIVREAKRNASGSHDLFNGQSSGGGRSGTSQSAVAAALARRADRGGFGQGGGSDDHRPRYANGRAPRSDDPEIEDADWSPAPRYSAAH